MRDKGIRGIYERLAHQAETVPEAVREAIEKRNNTICKNRMREWLYNHGMRAGRCLILTADGWAEFIPGSSASFGLWRKGVRKIVSKPKFEGAV